MVNTNIIANKWAVQIRLDMATDVDVDMDKNSNADMKFRCGHLKSTDHTV